MKYGVIKYMTGALYLPNSTIYFISQLLDKHQNIFFLNVNLHNSTHELVIFGNMYLSNLKSKMTFILLMF